MPDFVNDSVSGLTFEASVRQVARQLYRHASASGSIILDGRERDEVIDTGTELIVVEATKLRTLEKVVGDLKKSGELIKELRKSSKFSEYNFRVILVTEDDPTAHQNDHVKSSKIGCPKEIISFTELFSRLFNARHYIRVRSDHSFGSVRDPVDESNIYVPADDYIPTALNDSGTGLAIRSSDLASNIINGGLYVIYGDYGSGKSMTLRDVYFKIRDRFISGESLSCPIYLNLREHIAQAQPDEALYRHAEKIGFPEPHSLISAWRAGFVTLFLDGFDELTPPQFMSSVSNLRQARRFAVEIVRRFIEQTPRRAAVIIAGRESYFDDRDDAKQALGYSNRAQVFDLAGFTDQDVARFLNTRKGNIPSWLPTRPLLLGYLANAGLLRGQDELLSLDPANGWDKMLQRVCEREVNQVWGVGFEANDLRRFIEGLSTCARKSRDGRGLESSGLSTVYCKVFGRDADEPANLLTLRLPGLGSVPGRPGAREFIDADFAEAAASGDLRRYIENPFDPNPPMEDVIFGLGGLGRDMAVSRIPNIAAKVSLALRQSGQNRRLSTTAADLISILVDRQLGYKGEILNIEDAHFESVIVDPTFDSSPITFSRCTIVKVELGRSATGGSDGYSLTFHDCVIDRFEGALSKEDVPGGLLTGTTSVEMFVEAVATNNAVINLSLPDPVKVLLTILRKLFIQRGTGRRYNALQRGLPLKLVKYVDPIISLIKSNNFAIEVYLDRRVIIMPNRSMSSDALSIINGPNESQSDLMKSVRGIV